MLCVHVCMHRWSYLFTASDKPLSSSTGVPIQISPPPLLPTDIGEEIYTKSTEPLKDYSWYWSDLSRYVL